MRFAGSVETPQFLAELWGEAYAAPTPRPADDNLHTPWRRLLSSLALLY
jgi:hypothetical protein